MQVAAVLRRSLVLGLALLAPGCDACRSEPGGAGVGSAAVRAAAPGPPSARPAAIAARGSGARLRELDWRFPNTELGAMRVLIVVPVATRADERFPVLIAMHGRGEAAKGVDRGARGWIDDYGLLRAVERLNAPPLSSTDLQSLYDADRLADLNARLLQHPYRGLIVVCPYTPDILAGDRGFSLAAPLARFIVNELLPRVYRETPALGTARGTGIDGVSLGGRAALLVGLARPEAFGTVAALQPAFDGAEAVALAKRARAALATNPSLRLRLLTSDGDYFLGATRAIARAFERHGVPHELAVVAGPHDYAFNRGPGVYEMLAFHDRALRAP
jgi:enterochelin esterase-like enzyme